MYYFPFKKSPFMLSLMIWLFIFLLLYFPVIYSLKVVLMVVQKLKYISLIVKVEYKILLLFIPFQSSNFKTQIHLPLFVCYIIIYSTYVYGKPNKLQFFFSCMKRTSRISFNMRMLLIIDYSFCQKNISSTSSCPQWEGYVLSIEVTF